MKNAPRLESSTTSGSGAREVPGRRDALPTILVVDDHPMNCELMEAMLAPEGYRVESVYSGAAALAKVREDPPALILLDVSMPEMDGFEVTRRLRASEETRLIPIVMVTALGDLEHRVRGLESGAEDYLSKPVNRSELLARVQSSLRLSYYHRQVDERQKLELVLADVSDGILILNAAAELRDANGSAKRLLGLADDPQGLALAAVWGELRSVPADLAETVRSGRALDFVVERVDPQLFLAVSLRPVLDMDGVATGAVLALRDVTRETLEHKLQEDALSLVSHKLRTPLTVVGLWTKLLIDGECGPVTPEQRDALNAMLDASDQLRHLLEGMLSYLEWTKRLHRLQRRLVTFEELQSNLGQRTQGILGSEHHLFFEIQARGQLLIDEDLFVEALVELVRNAVKFGGGKPIEVRITMREAAGKTELVVADNGPGIPPEKLERIFERFYQVEEDFTGQVHGFGLGLALVKTAVEAMGGRIQARSQLGHGTRIEIVM